ncbi:hypothetical protein EMIT07CA2_80055 [Brevibacillus sp. IT-7CA2]
MNAVQLKQAVTISLTKQVQATAQAQASMMLEGLAKTQQNVQEAQASHPSLVKPIYMREYFVKRTRPVPRPFLFFAVEKGTVAIWTYFVVRIHCELASLYVVKLLLDALLSPVN